MENQKPPFSVNKYGEIVSKMIPLKGNSDREIIVDPELTRNDPSLIPDTQDSIDARRRALDFLKTSGPT